MSKTLISQSVLKANSILSTFSTCLSLHTVLDLTAHVQYVLASRKMYCTRFSSHLGWITEYPDCLGSQILSCTTFVAKGAYSPLFTLASVRQQWSKLSKRALASKLRMKRVAEAVSAVHIEKKGRAVKHPDRLREIVDISSTINSVKSRWPASVPSCWLHWMWPRETSCISLVSKDWGNPSQF